MSQLEAACQRCGASISGVMRFCPGCGRRQTTATLPITRRYGAIISVAVVLFGASFGLKSALHWQRGDVKPTEHVQVPREEPAAEPELVALRSDLERSPQDLGALRALAGFLAEKIRNRPDAALALVFEAIDVLSRILMLAPDDPDALLLMGDISFDQKAFVKAVEFYERYLKLMPSDLGATARYASTLTFIGRYDESVKQLESVLGRDPSNFPAMAYLAITFAQKGELNKAKELGNKALQLAPSDEARARFSGFVDSLSTGQTASVPDRQSNAAEPSTGRGLAGFIAAVKANPIAGPKFVRYDDKTPGVLKLAFREFPMHQMPPFAKEKFFAGLKASAVAEGLSLPTTIIFVDDSTGGEMERLSL